MVFAVRRVVERISKYIPALQTLVGQTQSMTI